MSETKKFRLFPLISFIPALAYWYLEANASLKIALVGGMGLAFFECLLEKILFKHIHTISKINFILIAFFGGISLVGEDGFWFKLQPCLTGMGLGGFLFVQNKRGKSILWEAACEIHGSSLKRDLIEQIERHLALFMSCYGLFMGAVSIWFSTDLWLFFKTIGFYLAFFLFLAGEIILQRLKFKQHRVGY